MYGEDRDERKKRDYRDRKKKCRKIATDLALT